MINKLISYKFKSSINLSIIYVPGYIPSERHPPGGGNQIIHFGERNIFPKEPSNRLDYKGGGGDYKNSGRYIPPAHPQQYILSAFCEQCSSFLSLFPVQPSIISVEQSCPFVIGVFPQQEGRPLYKNTIMSYGFSDHKDVMRSYQRA